jgi:glycosyltransferase involved in cell wall biosynthesis
MDQFNFDDFKTVSYMDAARALNIGIQPTEFGFFEMEGSIVLEKYIKQYEELFNPELIIRNSMCACLMKHNTPTITVLDSNNIRASEIWSSNNFINPFNFWRLRYGFTHIQKTSIEDAKSVVALTKQTADDYKKEFGTECAIIPNGIDIEKFHTRSDEDNSKIKKLYGIPEDKKIGVWAGNFLPNNWFFMPKLIKDFQDVFWLLLFKHGVNYMPKHTNLKIFTGPGAEIMPSLLSIGDFFIDPAFWNNFGIINIEAASCNVPIITSRTGYFHDAESGDIGEVVIKQEYDRYKKAIENVIKGEFEYHPREVVLQEKLTLAYWVENWKSLIKETVK